MLNAVILAGEQPIKDSSDTGNKALLRINGKIMIEYVIEALRNADQVGRIVVVGPKEQLEAYLKDKVDAVVNSDGTAMGNLMEAVNFLGYNSYMLVCSCDIPLITTEAINDFIKKSNELNADFCYPIVEKAVNMNKYPEMERTYVKVKEGSFTGGNIFYINPLILGKCLEIADKLVQARKNPIKMASILSFGFLLRLVTGTLSISKAEKHFSEMLSITAKAIISEYPEIGNDVDKPSDVIVATAHLSK